MLKIIIADDEALEREVYKVLISRNFPNLTVVAEAETGRQAVELFDIHKPDIILMDIRMPGINGLEAISEIRKRSKDIKVIVVSAYNFFDYAKEALKHGIEEYLLKPVAQDELIRVLTKTINKIEEERKLSKEELELKEKLKSIQPFLENEVSFAIMMGDEKKIRQYYKLLDLDITSGYLVIGRIIEESFHTEDEVVKSLTTKKVHEFIKENMPELKPCLMGEFISYKILLVFPVDKDLKSNELKEHSYKKVLKIRNAVKNNFTVKMCFGISEGFKDISEIKEAYNQALTVINNIDTFGIDIVNYGDIKSNTLPEFRYPMEEEKQLMEKIRLGLTEQALNSFHRIFEYTRNCLKEDFKRVKFELLELYFALCRMIYELDSQCTEIDEFILSRNKYYDLTTMQEIYSIFEEDIKSLCNRFNEERYRKTKNTMFMAAQYIKENFMKDLTLEEVAKKVCVSPNYFSRMFKNEFSQSFIDYLTKVRIEAAKSMIVSAGKSISDVCFEVGYSDPNYFTKVFKKVSGYTPSEYKELKLGQKA